jgi:uncharacterized protein
MPKLLAFVFFGLLIWQAEALNPSYTYAATPRDFGVNFEQAHIKTPDNMGLNSWYLKGPENSYKLMIISDDGEGNMADNLELAGNFVSMGYHVLMYDYRGFGNSSRIEINPNFLLYTQFVIDLESVLDHARKLYSNLRVVHLYGKGIGASLSIGVGCKRSDEVDKIIADCPYSSFEEIRNQVKKVENRDILVPLVYDKYILEPFYTSEKRFPKIKGILFIGGADDPVYTPKMIKDLSKRFDKATVYLAKGARYDSTFSSNRDEYFQQMKAFLKD